MNIKGIVSALPNMPPGDRDTVRKRAKSWLEAGSDEQKTAAQKVLVALEEVESQEVQQLAAHVDSLPLVNRR